MLDDDIQYIGTRPASSFVPNSPSSNQIVTLITGVILHVEGSATDAPYSLTFQRAATSVIHIGRRPGLEVERSHEETSKAMFRCAVVSRKHAKIAFSEIGHAYLIDLGSHHGTHIRRHGELTSKMLTKEVPLTLEDGDIITFGKSVGRSTETVRPVVVRVQLLRGVGHEPIFKPFTFPPLTPMKWASVPPDNSPCSSSSRSSSGRYGVFSSSSDGDSSQLSDRDSDIEEIPASGPNALPLRPRGSLSTDSAGSHLGRAFDALKRLLPPIHAPAQTSFDRDNALNEFVSPIQPTNSYPRVPSPDISTNSPLYLPSPIYSPRSPSEVSTNTRSLSPMFMVHGSPSINMCHDEGNMYSSPSGFDAAHHDVYEDSGLSSSPMDLASPSVNSTNPSPSPEQAPEEPSVIGAWPKSRSSSPFQSSSSNEAVCGQPIESTPSSSVDRNEQEPVLGNPDSTPGVVLQAPVETEMSETSPHAAAATSPAADLPSTLCVDLSELQSGLTKLRLEVTKLQSHRRKYKNRFNSNIHDISENLADLEERVSEVNGQYTMLLDQVENTAHVDIPELQAQIDALQQHANALICVPTNTSKPLLPEQSDVKDSIQTLRDIVDDMRKLRESTAAHMAGELETVRAARDAALATIAAHAMAPEAQTPGPSLSKRKRVDEPDEDEGELECPAGIDVGVGVGGAADVMMTDDAGPTTGTTTTTVMNSNGIDVPSPKRAKKIVSTVVHTAAAVTVGAVAAWSALAFS